MSPAMLGAGDIRCRMRKGERTRPSKYDPALALISVAAIAGLGQASIQPCFNARIEITHRLFYSRVITRTSALKLGRFALTTHVADGACRIMYLAFDSGLAALGFERTALKLHDAAGFMLGEGRGGKGERRQRRSCEREGGEFHLTVSLSSRVDIDQVTAGAGLTPAACPATSAPSHVQHCVWLSTA